MRDYIKLIETILLKENHYQVGDPIQALLGLNVFSDLEDVEAFDEIGFAPEFVAKWRRQSDSTRNRILSMPGIPLLPTMIEELEDMQYDGSDAYDPDLVSDLEGIYVDQLAFAEKICDQMAQLLKDPMVAKDMIIKYLLTVVKQDMGQQWAKPQIERMIKNLRAQGYDYPEFAVIKKSIN